MTTPKEVTKIYNKPELVCNYKKYQVFCENYGDNVPSIGMPEFLLYDGKSTRYANENEIHEIIALLPDD